MATKLTKTDEAYSIGLSKGFDNGIQLERERILKILSSHRDAHDEECEAQQWKVLDEVIRRIGG
jgi:hypothetical protein